jgi:TonB family protein
MRNLLVLSIFLVAARANAAGPGAATIVEVPLQESCREHIVGEPRLTIKDWPRQALGRDVSAYVAISYDLDGSGKAKNLRVADSQPTKLFDKTTLSILERTDFAPGIQAQSCMYVRTYGAVRRGER